MRNRWLRTLTLIVLVLGMVPLAAPQAPAVAALAEEAAAAVPSGEGPSPASLAFVQVAHLAPFAEDAGVDIWVGGILFPALAGVDYGDSSGYTSLPAAEYVIEIAPAGTETVVISATVELEAGSYYTAIAIGDGDNQELELLVLADDLTPPFDGHFRVRLGHLAPFAAGDATADIRLADGTPVVTDVVYSAVTPAYLHLEAGTYDLIITTPGGETTLIDPAPVTFEEGQILSAFATGDGVNQELGVFALPADEVGFFLPLKLYTVHLPLVTRDYNPYVTFTILHTNDFHARVDEYNRDGSRCDEDAAAAGLCIAGAPRLATLVEQFRADTENLLVLDAGDQFQGTLFFTLFQGEVLNTTMNHIGYDAMALGNHEFDSGPGVLVDFVEEADFPVLCANINIDPLNEPELAALVEPYVILERAGHRIGIIGLNTPDTENISSPGPHVTFTDPAASLQAAADELMDQGVNKIIALTHLGYEVDLELAASVSGVDVIIGGHSHSFLYDPPEPQRFAPPEYPRFAPLEPAGPYPTVVESPAAEPVLVVTAYQWGAFLGQLDVTFSPAGVVRSYAGNPIFLGADVAKDPTLDGMLDPYRDDVAELIATPVGTTTVDLPIDVAGQRICRLGECLIGNLVADAMLWGANEAEPEGNYQIAFQNGGGLRAPIMAGPVTMGDILETLPFGNAIATFQLEGTYVKEALENGASRYPSENGGFAQVSGLRYTINADEEVGDRISDIEVWNGVDWEPLVLTEIYNVVTNDFMRKGGDNYWMFRDHAIDPYDFGPALDEALAEYFIAFSPVTPEIEGRITIVD